MSEIQLYYEAFRQGRWATEDKATCLCKGSGWASSDVDTWHQCRIHYVNQPHPEDPYPEDVEPAAFTAMPEPVVAPYNYADDDIPF
jgi:hypothetical protein